MRTSKGYFSEFAIASQATSFIFSRNSKEVCSCSVALVVSNSVTPRSVAYQTPLSMEFSRQEYWSGLPCPPPGDLLDPGIKPLSLVSPAVAGRFFTTSTT